MSLPILVALLVLCPNPRPCRPLDDQAADCGPCRTDSCPAPLGCRAGAVPDRCGCCSECANLEGQACDPGRKNVLFGLCGDGLRCQAEPRPAGRRVDDQDEEEEEEEQMCVCEEREAVCGSDGVTYANMCHFKEAAFSDPELHTRGRGPCKTVPVIKVGPKSQVTRSGSHLVFLCEVFAFPMAAAEWRKDDDDDDVVLPGDDPHISVQCFYRVFVVLWIELLLRTVSSCIVSSGVCVKSVRREVAAMTSVHERSDKNRKLKPRTSASKDARDAQEVEDDDNGDNKGHECAARMDEDVKKEGHVFLQHHRFGKKWKSMWCVLFRESSFSISRLELREVKDGGGGEKKHRSGGKHTKVIRLSDLVRVSADVYAEACPADCAPFLLETVDKVLVLAARADHVSHWTTTLCQLAFPVSWEEPSKSRKQQLEQEQGKEEGIQDNALYASTTATGRDFRVCVRGTTSSERCRLKGDGVLRAGEDALYLLDSQGVTLMSWPYRFLRRFGRDKSCFSVEAGRRCASGEGNFEFCTKEGHFLFQAVEAAISLQRARQTSEGAPVGHDPSRKVNPPPLPPTPHAPHMQSSAARMGVALAQTLARVGRLKLDTCGGPCNPEILDSTYSQVSFPALRTPPCTPPPLRDAGEYSKVASSPPPTRLYDDTPASLYGKSDHIYDEPRVQEPAPLWVPCGPPSEYAAPEELKGDAWRVMATPADLRRQLSSAPKRARGPLPVAEQEARELYDDVTACQGEAMF
ncbi:docking protein 2-like [Phycodurus eques]|uniref:docking protein 2-like n=1 Tax=Phycodurus eques TaxID=693459 RepID=UPI002ACE3BAF|nr:docking protein 2-like [Phycodurus eques]